MLCSGRGPEHHQYSPNRSSQKRGREIYPEGKDILVVWLIRSPVGVLACLVRWNQVHEVQRCVEQLQTRVVCVCRGDFVQHFGVPFGLCVSYDCVEVCFCWDFVLHVATGFGG